MQGGTYPSGALRAPSSRAPLIAALIALVVGGAIATGIWWLTDNDVSILPEAETATRVIVAEPGIAGDGTAAKNEANTAVMVSPAGPAPVGVKDEAATAAAVGSGLHPPGQGVQP